MKTEYHLLSDRELATVLAALRFYQQCGLAEHAERRSDEIHAFATNDAPVVPSLNDAGIDTLCEKLNCEGVSPAVLHRKQVVHALDLAIARAKRELEYWPTKQTGSSGHRLLRAALRHYEKALDSLIDPAITRRIDTILLLKASSL